MEDCIFCRIIKKEIPARIIDENDLVVVFLSLQNHPLIVPKQHIETIYNLDDKTGAAVMSEAIKIAKAVKNGLKADGVNILQNNEAAANQEVMHFHMHIRPRYLNNQVKLHIPSSETSDQEKSRIVEDIQSALS